MLMKYLKIWVLIGLFGVWGATSWLFYLHLDSDKKNLEQERLKNVRIDWNAVTLLQQKGKDIYFDVAVNNGRTLSLLKDALIPTKRDDVRQALYQSLQKTYVKMVKDGIYQFQFTLPDSTSLLRFHAPKYFGDNLGDLRSSYQSSNRFHKEIQGFELGRIAVGLRYVFPLSYAGENVGSVELSSRLETLLHNIRLLNKQTDYSFIFHPRLQSALFESFHSNYMPSLFDPDWWMENPKSPLFSDIEPPSEYMKNVASSLRKKAGLSERLNQEKPFAQVVELEGVSQLVMFLPVFDIENTLLGYLVSATDAYVLDRLNEDFLIQILLTALFLGLVGFIAFRVMKHQDDLRVAATAFNVQEAMMITDESRKILRVNKAFTQITGYSEDDVVGQDPKLLSSGRQSRAFYNDMWTVLNEEGVWLGEIWNRRKNGEEYYERLSILAVNNRQGQVTHYVGAFFDITKSKKDEAEIRRLGFFDSLTGLANRRLVMNRLQHAIDSIKRTHQYAALLFIDMDRFKNLNDTKGHEFGDKLLVQVGERLNIAVREGDTVGRLGGDEFVVLFEGLDTCLDKAAHEVEILAEKIKESLSAPYDLSGFSYITTPSIGLALFSDSHHLTVDEILHKADSAMYQAKQSGGHAVRLFDPQLQMILEDKRRLESDLKQALMLSQFELYYQPQVNQSGQVTGAEALLRWRHPQKNWVSPQEFIPVAEESGLIVPIGDWVVDQACNTLASWQNEDSLSALTLAVNISAEQLRQDNFVEKMMACVKRYQVPVSKLKLELTESMILHDIEDSIRKLNALTNLGFMLSADDFGTGYSSLLSIKNLPFRQIKIDQSFVESLLFDAKAEALTRSIISMSKALELNVIAEGVETLSQQQRLVVLGCYHFQGYLYSKPLPYSAFLAYCRHVV